jgi:hypothetical protein
MRAANRHIERRARRERRKQLRGRQMVQPASVAQTSQRKGSTLLVVMALMGMLALLGLMFFSFASQEEESAKNYLEAAKLIHDPALGPDVYFDWALRQAIRGPEREERQSALAGGHIAILSNQFGHDAHPHTGAGITIINDRTTDRAAATPTLGPLRLTVGADLNGDGMADTVTQGGPIDVNGNGIHDALEINRSTAANVINPNGGLPTAGVAHIDFEHRAERFPEPDVDYTYADVNNAYLAHIARIWVTEGDADGSGTFDADEDFNGNGAIDPTPYQVTILKPSYWRPELLTRFEDGSAGPFDEAGPDGVWDPLTEDVNGNGLYDTTDYNGNGSTSTGEDALARLDPTWYWAPWSRSLVLRPHPLHFFIPEMQRQIPGMPPPSPPAPPTQPRFLRDGDPTDAAIIASLPGGSRGFPFAGPRDLTSGDTIPLREGLWRGWRQEYSEDLNGNGSLDPGEDRNGNGVIDQVNYEFDADADNDGIREAILLDLGFPVQARPSDGALYVPMFALTIYDADGLINLNTSGNLAGDTTPPTIGPGGIFGNAQGAALTAPQQLSISKSLYGLTPFEINPLWALDGVPIDPPGNPTPPPNQTVDTTAIGDYLPYFGRNPLGNGDTVNRWELANMELWWLNKGRVEFGGALPEVHAGRLGEEDRVWQVLQAAGGAAPINLNLYNPGATNQTINLFPFPGYFDRDDNRNANYGGAGNVSNGRTLAFGHPLSVSGRGRFTNIANPKQLNPHTALGSPMRWLSYVDYDVAGAPQWATGAVVGGNLMTGTRVGSLFLIPAPPSNPGADVLIDDLTELTVEPRSAKRPADDILSVSEAAGLHLAKTDIDKVGVHSRVHHLMPGNINPSDTSVEANERRRRFTPISWDRKQFSLPIRSAPGPDGQPGQAGVDDNRNGLVDEAQELGWPGSDDHRSWEFNVDSDQDGRFEFPPQFGVAAYSGQAQGALPQVPQDPFRAEVRRLLSVERGNQSELKLQFRLNLNQLVDVVRTGRNGGHPIHSALEFRPLTPHPNADLSPSLALPAGNSVPVIAPGGQLPAINSTSVANQEFWARYDRQRMARDIYVLLYTLCGGDTSTTGGPLTLSFNPTNSSTFYSDREKQEMAQFAVNLVDQLDPDNVFTVFEYDTDLSDGWNLDDQAVTNEGASVRGVVVGVEAQELTFSETLWVFQDELANDNTHTPFDESSAPTGAGTPGFHFAQIELRNASPRSVNLARTASTSATTGVWRIRWEDTADIADIDQVSTTPALPSGNGVVLRAPVSPNALSAGALFTIATSNYTGADAADLYVNHDTSTPEFELVAPANGPLPRSVAPPATGLTPKSNLDLVHNTTAGYTDRYELINGVRGDFISPDFEPSMDNPVLVLERRADPTQPQLSVAHNPWVVVDWTRFQKRDFVPEAAGMSGSPSSSDTNNRLQTLRSWQRQQPLDGEQENLHGAATVANSLMGNNTGSPGSYDLVQLHFDRDFASVIDVFNQSISAPMYTTRSITKDDSFTAGDIILDPLATVGGGSGGPPGMGGGPGNGVGNGGVPPGLAKQQNRYGNHWHRLLSLVEVPTKMHQQLGSEFETTRVPGKVNLNTLRHPEVLAALFDNPFLHGEINPATGIMPGIDGNNWWRDFLVSRDGEHPDFPGTGFTLPGYFSSEPFRDLGHTDDLTAGENPVEDTILRDRPPGLPGPANGRLFDIDVPATTAGHDLLRRQLLTKVMNNTTTRSNVFFAFIQVQFHEAYEDPATGAIRVGGRIDLNSDSIRDDGHRGFFVIDRSAAEEAYDTKTGTFDWRQLVKYRLTIN